MKFKKSESGSVTLEAALVMPFFLAFVIALILLIRIMVTDLALHNAVTEANKQVSTHAYPLMLAEEKANEFDVRLIFNSIISQKNFYLEALNNNDVKDLDQSVRETINASISGGINSMFAEFVRMYADENMINPSKIEVTNVETPITNILNGDTYKDFYFIIDVQYVIDLPIPFMSRTITLKERSVERAWLGG